MNTQTESQLPIMCQSYDIGFDSLYLVNGEKFKSHAVTLTLIKQCPMVRAISLYYNMFKFQVDWALNQHFRTLSFLDNYGRFHIRTVWK